MKKLFTIFVLFCAFTTLNAQNITVKKLYATDSIGIGVKNPLEKFDIDTGNLMLDCEYGLKWTSYSGSVQFWGLATDTLNRIVQYGTWVVDVLESPINGGDILNYNIRLNSGSAATTSESYNIGINGDKMVSVIGISDGAGSTSATKFKTDTDSVLLQNVPVVQKDTTLWMDKNVVYKSYEPIVYGGAYFGDSCSNTNISMSSDGVWYKIIGDDLDLWSTMLNQDINLDGDSLTISKAGRYEIILTVSDSIALGAGENADFSIATSKNGAIQNPPATHSHDGDIDEFQSLTYITILDISANDDIAIYGRRNGDGEIVWFCSGHIIIRRID